jgi:signal transduction histidine kinase
MMQPEFPAVPAVPALPGDVAEGDGRVPPADRHLAAQLVTARRELAQRTRQLKRSEQTNQSRSAFLAGITHDLRTPLTAIIGYSDLLVMGVPEKVPDASHEHVQRIRTSARQLLSLLDELLAFARDEGAVMSDAIGSQDAPGEVAR